MRSFNPGMTLVEVMVSLMVFSAALGLISGFVKMGVEQPFAVYGTEEWLQFIEDSSNAVQSLPNGFDLNTLKTDRFPLNQVLKPADLKSWDIICHDTNFLELKVARFSALSAQNRTYQWSIYKKSE